MMNNGVNRKMMDLLRKRVVKMTVGDLKKSLMDCDDDTEVILSFYLKESGTESVYLAEANTHMKYDSVTKEKLSEPVVELVGYTDKYCQYVERKDGD